MKYIWKFVVPIDHSNVKTLAILSNAFDFVSVFIGIVLNVCDVMYGGSLELHLIASYNIGLECLYNT